MTLPLSAVYSYIVRDLAPGEDEPDEAPLTIVCEPLDVPAGASTHGTIILHLPAAPPTKRREAAQRRWLHVLIAARLALRAERVAVRLGQAPAQERVFITWEWALLTVLVALTGVATALLAMGRFGLLSASCPSHRFHE
jgi:hypothetical protein